MLKFRRISHVISRKFLSCKRQKDKTKLCGHEITYSSGKLCLDNPPNWFKVHPYPDPRKPGIVNVRSFILSPFSWPLFSLFNKLIKGGSVAANLKRLQRCPSNAQMMNFKPPDAVRGMQILDRSLFKTSAKIPGIKVPTKILNALMKKIKKDTVKIVGVKPVVKLDDEDELSASHKLVLLDPRKHPDADSFSEMQLQLFTDHNVDVAQFSSYDIDLGYENWTADDTLRAVLPEDQDSVSGFTLIGHIAHINLKSNLLEYKNVIGEVLLDKLSTVRTVVNKLDTIDNTFRNFKLEVLAGEANFITTAKENGFSFEMDFSKVYWNSRLSTEHQRIIDQLKPYDIVYDVFAGIGPFSVPAAKKRCVVIANDLNPESYKWLQHNVKKNKIIKIATHNLDGRDFIRTVMKPDLQNRLSGKTEFDRSSQVHVVMNLPALALEFLDVFQGLLEDNDEADFIEPMVHCYCFSKEEDYVKDILERVKISLGDALPEGYVIRHVRHVAPNKDMYCVEFSLKKDVLVKSCNEEPPLKRVKSTDMTEDEKKVD